MDKPALCVEARRSLSLTSRDHERTPRNQRIQEDTTLKCFTKVSISITVVSRDDRLVTQHSGVLQHLKFVMRSKSVDVQREAVRGVANISAEYAYTAVIAGAGAIMPLVAMLSSPDFLCQR